MNVQPSAFAEACRARMVCFFPVSLCVPRSTTFVGSAACFGFVFCTWEGSNTERYVTRAHDLDRWKSGLDECVHVHRWMWTGKEV